MKILLLIGLVVAVAILIRGAYSRARKKSTFLALCEYWVYIEGSEIPVQQALMDRMINANPHNRPGKPCIGAREGMLFTDIRLSVALAKKSKNPLVFRPDLFQSDLTVDKEIIERLALAQSLIKVRYCSTVPLTDTRHLQFVPHMADAMADLAQGLLVYDVVSENIVRREDFFAALGSNNNAERADAHIRAEWVNDVASGVCHAITKGLRKIGLSDLRSDPVTIDQRTLATSLTLEAAKKVFAQKSTEGTFEIEGFGDVFEIELGKVEEGHVRFSIKRRVVGSIT